MSKYLTPKQILDAEDRKFKDLDVPEWGGTVRISTLSGKARDRFEGSILNKQGGVNHQNIRAKLCAACLVDEDGKLMFTENEIERLGEKSCTALDKVFAEAQKLNGIGQAEIDELAKN